jgi:predicted O-methyltransferase YrrM
MICGMDDLQSPSGPTQPSAGSERMEWSDGNLQVGSTRFTLSTDPTTWNEWESTADQFVLLKSKHQLDSLLRFAPEQVQNVVDLGIFKGGSIALYQELFSPKRLVGIDLLADRVAALDEFVARRSLSETVRLYYGTSQGDQALLTKIVRENFGDEPLDLVIDDASHKYSLTKASLNVLLPRIRPGGVYVLEDWGWAHYPGEFPQRRQETEKYFADSPTPLSRLVLELVMVVASRPDLVSEVNVVPGIVFVTRGRASVPEAGFDIGDFYSTPGRKILHEDRPLHWWHRLLRT